MGSEQLPVFNRRTALVGGGGLLLGLGLPPPASAAQIHIWRHYADTRYGQMHFRSAEPADGSGADRTPLVCLHQSPGSALEFLEFQAVMAADRRVLCPDTAGYGASDGPTTQPEMDDYGGALADALTALGYGAEGAGPVDVLGFHTGNFVATALALQRPDLVRRLVMPSIPYFPPELREARRVQYGQPRPYFTDPDMVGSSYRSTVLERNNGVPIQRRHDLFVSRLRAGPDSYFGFDAVFRYDADTALAAITQPVLLPVLNETLGEPTRQASSLIKNAELLERPDLNGLVWFLRPGAMADVVRGFLDRPPPAAAAAPTAAMVARTQSAGGEGDRPGDIRHWRHYANNRYGQMHFTSATPAATDKPPVVLFHQSPLSAVVFKELTAALAVRRTVHGADTPGFGDSDGPGSQPTMMDLGGATAEALIDMGYGPDGRGPVDLFGFHTGSFLATEVARQAPALVRRVILCGVPYYPADMRITMMNKFLSPYAFFTDPDYVDRMYKRIVVEGDAKTPPRRRLERFTDRMRAGPKGEFGPRAVFSYDADAGLTALTQPTLLMAFDEVMTEPTREVQRLLPEAEFLQLSGIAMMGFMSEPARVARVIGEFLDRPVPAPAPVAEDAAPEPTGR
jgi:pimeloyl-ACP methyl ester carboxylesterase